MLIQYKTTRHKREVKPECGHRLVKAGIATKVSKPRALKAKPAPAAGAAEELAAPGKYERRDLNTEG